MEASILIYIIIMNLWCFYLFGSDKKRSRSKKWRISESQLLVISFLGGSLGGLLAMVVFRHKTNKWKFKILLPLFLGLHIFLFYYILNYNALQSTQIYL